MIKFKKFIADIPDKEVLKYLATFKRDEEIKTTLRLIYDPKILTGLSYGFLFENLYNQRFNKSIELYTAVRYFITNGTLVSKQKKLEIIRSIYYTLEDVDLISKIFSKTLSLGFNVKTLNKAFGKDFIKEFKVMKLGTYDPENHKLRDSEIVIQEKVDGVRGLFINGKFYTRAGHEIIGLVDIKKDLENFPADIVLDGELFYKSLTETIKAIAENQNDLVYHVFDSVPIEEYQEKKEFSEPYSERHNRLKILCGDCRKIVVSKNLYDGKYNSSTIDHIFEEMLDKNLEGIVIKDKNSLYEFKRSDRYLKLKEKDTEDLEIIQFVKGTDSGKYKDTLGAIVVRYFGPDGKETTVNVSSGLSEELRDEIWNNQLDYLGKTIEVEFRKTSVNEDGVYSLQHPRFKRFRTDK